MATTRVTGAATLLITGVMALSACGSDDADPINPSAGAPESQTSSAVGNTESLSTVAGDNGRGNSDALAMTQAWFGDLDGMVERRVIRILTVYGPGRYYLHDEPKGVTAEYGERLERVVNEAFDTGHRKVVVAIIPVARDQLFPALLAGRGDIIVAGTTITDARKSEADFTIPASKPLREILVTGPAAPDVQSLNDLAGQTVHVRESSSYAESVRALSASLVEAGQAPINIEPVSELLEDEDLIEMVNAGLLPWAVVDDYKTQMWTDVFSDIKARKDLVLREGARLGWAFRKDSPRLKTFLNEFLKETREGTRFGNILRNRYVRDFDWASNALATEELSKYRKLEEYFRRHGASYGMDPALLAAQGFQESRLSQDVRSAAGAIGVMQVLPSTARDKNVAIDGIERVDPNIEAGAKYMAFLRERYFRGDEYDTLNSSLMALAAYNAGPAKVRRLQKTAEQRGYDPTRWFDNVEVIAAEQIGRETTQYVANIYKYYLSYEMINRQTRLRDAAKSEFEEQID